ncbi:hypothetical protein EZS27_030385, partial [termite gut metagenome]
RLYGHEFKVYKKDNSSKNSLSENNIETLMFDSKGLLWIGFKSGGVDVYNPRKNEFIHISKLIRDYPQRVVSIFEDSQHNIWLGSWGDGCYQLIPSGETYRVVKHFPQYIVSAMIEKPKGMLWVGTYYGYFLYDIYKNKWVDVRNTGYSITQFLDTGKESNLLYSSWKGGMFKLQWDDSLQNITETYVEKSSGDIYCMYKTSDHKIYLGTWGDGLKVVEIPSHQSKIVSMSAINSFQAPVIESFFHDSYNKLWIGTYGTGLYCIDVRERGLTSLSPINKNGYSAAYALKHFGNNYALIGSQGDGLYLYDLENCRLIPKRIKGESGSFNKYILSLYCDNEILIVGNDDTGIYYAPLGESKDIRFSLHTFYADRHLGKVTSIFKDSNSNYWLGTKQDGLISLKYDAQKKSFTDYVHYEFTEMGEITGFAERTDGRLWISSHNGIYLFSPLTKEIERYETKSDKSEMIYSLADDKKNKCIWLGTSVGLGKIDYADDTDKIEQVLPAELLPVGAIKDVVLDAYNNLWFSIVNRIFCLLDQEKKIKEINMDIGVVQSILSSSATEINGKPYILFGGTDKLLLIDPQKILNQPDQTKIVWTGLEIDHHKINVGEKLYGNIILKEETEYTKSIRLSYRCKWISLSFTERGWDNYRNKYQYRIEGFIDSWQYLDVTKPFTFSQLPSGDYTLSIRNNEDTLQPNENFHWNLNITIIPPWWQTLPFWIILFGVIILILVYVFIAIKGYYKKRQILRLKELEKKKKEELLQEKESFFVGLSHDLLTPFSLIIAPTNDL